uniref:Uncharacterized protein n=1 Tax=viral metagenome TaxID=1070528 RepID=A0A6C0I489_9ZZZZ
MPKKKKIQKIMNPVKINPNAYKMCPIIWDRNECGISILTMENAHPQYNRNPMFYVPLRKFMQCGGMWSALNLCTVFWEPPLYGIPRDHVENERVKGAYLIAFASDLAPICKEWARAALKQCNYPIVESNDAVFVEIVLFNEARKAQMMDAISRHNLQVTICEVTNTCTVI